MVVHPVDCHSDGHSDCLCSVVLAADDAASLASFYGALVQQSPAAGLSPRHWRLLLPGGGLLEIYTPSRGRQRPQQAGRLALCLRRPGGRRELEAWLAAAIGHGACLAEPPRGEVFGWEAWLVDPEGNRLLLLVTPGASESP